MLYLQGSCYDDDGGSGCGVGGASGECIVVDAAGGSADATGETGRDECRTSGGMCGTAIVNDGGGGEECDDGVLVEEDLEGEEDCVAG